jgi:hypothetical protein
LGAVFAERGGDLLVAAPVSREADLDRLLLDLVDAAGLRFCTEEEVANSPSVAQGRTPRRQAPQRSTSAERWDHS